MKDTGIGIPEEKRQRLFEKFYQVEDHLTRNQEGTGLGLAIVKQLVELHRGQITVASTPGKGTAFTVRIPQELFRIHGYSTKVSFTSYLSLRTDAPWLAYHLRLLILVPSIWSAGTYGLSWAVARVTWSLTANTPG